ncbi:MAG: transglutaminase family protein [Desulfosalsimonadaceae bacterium]
MDIYTRSTAFIDSDAATVSAFARRAAGESPDTRTRAVRLYYAVRDEIRYDPYSIDLSTEGLRASTTLKNGSGWCVAKAILLAACCRCMGIAARLGFADVKNHLSTQRLRQQMQTDIFYWHGYTAIYAEEKWIKTTPAFNRELCEKFSLKPLEFDGKTDSLFHPFDREGNRHMEYILYRGEFADVPLQQIAKTFREKYPAEKNGWIGGDFDKEADKETGR